MPGTHPPVTHSLLRSGGGDGEAGRSRRAVRPCDDRTDGRPGGLAHPRVVIRYGWDSMTEAPCGAKRPASRAHNLPPRVQAWIPD